MIENDQMITYTLRAMTKLEAGEIIIVQCFKQDRELMVAKADTGIDV